MSLYDLVVRYSSFTLQAVDVLREQLQQQSFIGQQTDEGVGYSRLVFSRIQFMCKCIEWKGVLAKKGNIEHRFRIWKFETSEVCIKPCIGGSEIWDAGRRTNPGTCLPKSGHFVLFSLTSISRKSYQDYDSFDAVLFNQLCN